MTGAPTMRPLALQLALLVASPAWALTPSAVGNAATVSGVTPGTGGLALLPLATSTTLADATSITPSAAAFVSSQTNTQPAGTLTVATPSNTPFVGEVIWLSITATNTQTFAFSAAYTGGTTASLPTVTSSGAVTDLFPFLYTPSGKWAALRAYYGYTP